MRIRLPGLLICAHYLASAGDHRFKLDSQAVLGRREILGVQRFRLSLVVFLFLP